MGARETQHSITLHASSVAVGRCAVLIRGQSGSGKSSLALGLMALGARLIADDRTVLQLSGAEVIASAPEAVLGQIEARGVGILRVPVAPPTPVRLIVDLDVDETERLPERHMYEIMGQAIPLVRKSPVAHFPASILVYLQGDRID